MECEGRQKNHETMLEAREKDHGFTSHISMPMARQKKKQANKHCGGDEKSQTAKKRPACGDLGLPTCCNRQQEPQPHTLREHLGEEQGAGWT